MRNHENRKAIAAAALAAMMAAACVAAFMLIFPLPGRAGAAPPQGGAAPGPAIYGPQKVSYMQGREPDLLAEAFSPGASLSVETDMDPSVPGMYAVRYVATDGDGNTGMKGMAAEIIPEIPGAAPEEEIYALADRVLSAVITDGMGDYEKCLAVYGYLHSIPYTGAVPPEDCLQAAYQMLAMRTGDCFSYYSASRLLLERLGYKVLKMENCNGFTHVWCLVSADGGETWRHFDPTCWRWGEAGVLCMVTDAELEEYAAWCSASYGTQTHCWDRQACPAAE